MFTTLKRQQKAKRSLGVTATIGGAAMLCLIGSLLTMRHAQVNATQAADRQTQILQNTKDNAAKATKLGAEQITNKSNSNTPDAASAQQLNPSTKSAAPSATGTKYATSSDPTSTAYSTTPPKPNPASFDIAITHANQVAAGTTVSYNATKNEREIYGGDLSLNPSTITYSRSGSSSASWRNITVSTPDGATVGMPSEPYNDNSPYFSIGSDASQYKSEGSSFSMVITVNGNITSNGSYRLHIMTHRTTQTPDGYEYDGFITINVVD